MTILAWHSLVIVVCLAALIRICAFSQLYKTKQSIARCSLRAVTEAHEGQPRKVRLGAIRTMLNAQHKNESVSKVSILAKMLEGTSGSVSLQNASADDMLNSLFAEEASQKHLIEPFDDMKVMLKLRRLLKPEDLEGIFRDPVVGE